MARNTPLTIVSYAVNGLGLGHLTRIIAINTAIRQFCLLLEQHVHQIILTTSEADTLAFKHSFSAYKMPSVTLAHESGIPRKRYNMISRHWVWNAFALWQPDISIVDTFPTGTFDELPQILRDCKKNVFIYRPIKPEQEKNPKFREALFMYDNIIRITEPFSTAIPVDERLSERVTDVSPIILPKYEKSSILSARSYKTEKHTHKKSVLVLAGGGGDSDNSSFWETMTTIALDFPDIRFTYAVGALYRGTMPEIDNVIWNTDELDLSYGNYDIAISAGGFNSVYELLYYKIPTIFFSQERKYDDQNKRIRTISEQGMGLYIEQFSHESVTQHLNDLLYHNEHLKHNLERFSFVNGSIETAYTALTQCVPLSRLDAAKDVLEYFYRFNTMFAIADEKVFFGIIGLVLQYCEREHIILNIEDIVSFAHEIINTMNTKGYSLKDTYTLIRNQIKGINHSDEIAEIMNYKLHSF